MLTQKVMVKRSAKADVFDYIFYVQMFWHILFFIFWTGNLVESNLLKLTPSLADPHDLYNKLVIIFCIFIPLFLGFKKDVYFPNSKAWYF